MNDYLTRRKFLQAGLLGGTSVAIFGPSHGLAAKAGEQGQGFCVTLCNHWSYIGIGWQLGIESCVLSATDAMEMADRAPHVKTCLNLDAHAYEVMAGYFPEVVEKLKRYVAEGKVEPIGGTYGQPMGTTFSGESNIRQLVYGREAVRKVLGFEMATFLEEEEFSHPQVPQIARGARYLYGSLAQVDTWGNAGIPHLEVDAFNWQGKDGTTLPSTPKNSLFGFSPDMEKLAKSQAFRKLQEMGKPLIFTWEEFGWEPPDEPAYLKTPEKYQKLAEKSPVEFVSLKEYMDKYGAHPKKTVFFNMDAWNKLLTWGLGGDQLRILDRKVEALLLAAERFDAVAGTLGAKSKAQSLEDGWKHLLTSQSHDVGLCEYSRWQGDRMAPLDRVEDYHNFTWGVIGFNHLDAARKQGREVLDASLAYIRGRVEARPGKQTGLAVSVFNPYEWPRSGIATTGRLYPIPEKTRDLVIKDGAGRVVPSQVIRSGKDSEGNLTVADVAFSAHGVPGVGYDTYYVEFSSEVVPPPSTDLSINEQALEMENKFVKVKLGSTHGAVISLIDKRTGKELLNPAKSPFPVFKGTPNQDYSLRNAFLRGKYKPQELVCPAEFDSSQSVAEIMRPEQAGEAPNYAYWNTISRSDIRWMEKGPLRATLRARHNWPLLKFETDITLCAGSPRVEVVSRALAEIPPAPDKLDAQGRFPIEIQRGYWLKFAPAFQAVSVIRDYPLAIEPTERPAFQARTFVDLVGKDAGLLLLHSGTQYFKWENDGVLANLLMREWESFFSGEYGWPRYAEYRHALVPHTGELTNAARLQAAAEFSQDLLTRAGPPLTGELPARKSFVAVSPENAQITAFRRKEGRHMEIRMVEVEGKNSGVSVEFNFPVNSAVETNLLGQKVGDVAREEKRLKFEIQPWKIRTFELA